MVLNFYNAFQNGRSVKVTVQFAIEQASGAPETCRAPRIPLPTSIQGHFDSEEIRVPLLTFLMEYVFSAIFYFFKCW